MKANNVAAAAAMVAALFASVSAFADYWDGSCTDFECGDPCSDPEWTDPETGYTWYYRTTRDAAEIYTDWNPDIDSDFWGLTAVRLYEYEDGVRQDDLEPLPIAGALRIPSKIGGKPVTKIGPNAFYYLDQLTSVTIPDSVTSIGYCSFCCCSKLTRVSIPSGVTSIGYCAFSDCSELASVTIPDSVTSVGCWAFDCCSESLYDETSIPGVILVDGWAVGYTSALSGALDLSGVRGIAESAFSGCSGLTSVTIPGNVLNIGDFAFSDCGGLTSVTICNGVRSIGCEAFGNCGNLANVAIPRSVVDVGENAFADTPFLKNMPDGLIVFGRVAYGVKGTCPATVAIPEGVVGIRDDAFRGCVSLKNLTIPDSVTNIGARAFYECVGLTSLKLPDSVANIGGAAFYGCVGLAKNDFVIIRNVLHCYTGTGGNVVIPNGVTCIGDRAFYECRNLTGVKIADGLTSIGAEAFCGCSGLESIVFPSSVTDIGSCAFQRCTVEVTYEDPDDGFVYTVERTVLKNVVFEGNAPFYHASDEGGSDPGPFVWGSEIFVRKGSSGWGDYGYWNIPFVGCYLITYLENYVPQAPVMHTVAFNANGGTPANDAMSVTDNTAIGEMPEPVRKGYKFLGWFTAKKGGAAVTAETIVTGDMTVYAHWMAAWQVTFNANGGKIDGAASVKVLVQKGKAVGTLPKASKSGYSFKGWYTKKSKGSKISANTKIKKNITYYAQWTAKKYTVTLKKSGSGKVSGGGKKAYKSKITLKAKPSKGYVFSGWYLDGVLKSKKATWKTTVPLNGATYTAVFTKKTFK